MADYRKRTRQAAKRQGINPDVFERQIGQESGFNPNARSPAGAQGIAQIMPATAKGWGVDPTNPDAALGAAAKAMRKYLDAYHGSWSKALTAYNAGPGAVGKPLPGETRNYIKTILGGHGDVKASPSTGGSPSGRSSLLTSTRTTTSPKFDKAGFDEAQHRAVLGSFLAKRNPKSLLLRMGVLGTQQPNAADFISSQTHTTRTTTPGPSTRGGSGSSSTAHASGKGTSKFEGQQVAAWMVPALRYARKQGWKGQITSGVRTRSEQASLYANRGANPYPVAKPGQSNHEVENGGAVDVSDPQVLAQIMRTYKGKKLRQGTAIGDPVHFSASGR